ncbi:MAG: beta-galactosidase [Planctomycetes bacterium]|nr:beta-galactosidase [Planctomycetota bacterium]
MHTQSDRYPPISPKCPHMLHGGDYNPDQWPTEVWAEDMRLMKAAGCNAMSVGIFAWSRLEPQEGQYEFGWLDRIMDMLAENDAFAILATPSAARPAWLDARYPECCKVTAEGQRRDHGMRHNFCWSSPAFREKVTAINTRLAERYGTHPALLMWHVSNEYGGEGSGAPCYCELCQAWFRDWLRDRYDNDIETLNHAWWTAFWSSRYESFDQIDAPGPLGERAIHGLTLDWKRFNTHQAIDFYRHETSTLKRITPDVSCTTNFMWAFEPQDYWQWANEVDIVSWDGYPGWHCRGDDVREAAGAAFNHDLFRSLKAGRPFMLMESVPSVTSWFPVCKLKRPGMHKLSSLLAIAHGSDTVQYFQWRKSRGATEKFFGAVVDHVGHEDTRVFGDVAELGRVLKKLDGVVGTTVRSEVAVLFDWPTRWAVSAMSGLGHRHRNYLGTCMQHHAAFWTMGIGVDVIDQTVALDEYRLAVLPMLYMLRPGMAEKIERFVADGGTAVMTYWSGIVDEHDLCHLGGWPGGGLRKVFGVWDEETDAICEDDVQRLVLSEGNELGLAGEYEIHQLCALIHAEGATVAGTYGEDFYAGRPALTVNHYGDGKAWYVAARTGQDFLDDLYGRLASDLGLRRTLDATLPQGVTARMRTNGETDYVFVMNFTDAVAGVDLGETTFADVVNGGEVAGRLALPAYGVAILSRPAVEA